MINVTESDGPSVLLAGLNPAQLRFLSATGSPLNVSFEDGSVSTSIDSITSSRRCTVTKMCPFSVNYSH
ncbi:hypothetical protein Hanom_Chr08g00685581 [Helianthus anomalus]